MRIPDYIEKEHIPILKVYGHKHTTESIEDYLFDILSDPHEELLKSYESVEKYKSAICSLLAKEDCFTELEEICKNSADIR